MGTKEKDYHMTFGVLSGIAIVMIVAGHAGCDVLTVGGLFPYYSFHVPLFMFISGYFYRDENEEKPLSYCKRKVCRLLLPYFIWNIVYGIIAWMLRLGGFAMGGEIGIRTLFIEPFVSGYQFIYNYAAWFVPALFLIEMMNLLMRLLLKKLHLCHEGLILAGTLCVGMSVVWLAVRGHVWGLYKMPGRILFLYPCFQMGQFYRRKLERHDTLNNLPYFAIVVTAQFLLTMCCNGLAYSCVWCTGFANGPVIPYVTVVSGVAFWLRIAKITAPLLGKYRYIRYLCRNTYAVMMHHVMAFMLVKAVIALFSVYTPWCADFDMSLYRSNIDFYYLVRGMEQFRFVYVAAGILLPLLLQYGLEQARKFCRNRLKFGGK